MAAKAANFKLTAKIGGEYYALDQVYCAANAFQLRQGLQSAIGGSLGEERTFFGSRIPGIVSNIDIEPIINACPDANEGDIVAIAQANMDSAVRVLTNPENGLPSPAFPFEIDGTYYGPVRKKYHWRALCQALPMNLNNVI